MTFSINSNPLVAGMQFQAQSGTQYTANANGVFTGIPIIDVPSFLHAGMVLQSAVAGINNFAATTAPTATSDSTKGYGIGSRWLDTTNNNEYICESATASAAVWIEVVSSGVLNSTAATITVSAAVHANKVLTLNKASGQAITLPTATGTGNKYTFQVGTTITSVGTTVTTGVTGTGCDSYEGFAIQGGSAGAMTNFLTAAPGSTTGSDVITLNGTTTGGFIGDIIEVTDVAAGVWMTKVFTKISGTAATPFSHA